MGPRPAAAAAKVAAAARAAEAAAAAGVEDERAATGGPPSQPVGALGAPSSVEDAPPSEDDARPSEDERPSGAPAPTGQGAAAVSPPAESPEAPDAGPAEGAATPTEAPAPSGAESAPPDADRAPAAPYPDDTGEHNGRRQDTEDVVPIPRATPRQGPIRPPQPLRASQRSATVPPRRTPAGGRRAPASTVRAGGPGRGILIGGLAGVVVLAAIVVLVTQVLGGDDGTTVPNTTKPVPHTRAASNGPAKADTVVVVLNGTTSPGLAGDTKDKLEQAGYSADNIPAVTSNDQTAQTSTVYYARDRRHQGMTVARALDIDAVEPLDSDTQALAEQSQDAETSAKADVVVIAGADQTP